MYNKRIFSSTVHLCNLNLITLSYFFQNSILPSCFSTILSPICNSLTKGYSSNSAPPLVRAGLYCVILFNRGRASMYAIILGSVCYLKITISVLLARFRCGSTWIAVLTSVCSAYLANVVKYLSVLLIIP